MRRDDDIYSSDPLRWIELRLLLKKHRDMLDVMQDTDNLFQGAAELLSRIDGVRPFEYNSIRYKIEKHRETNYWLTRYASKIHGEFGMREAAFRDDMKPVVERLSIITLDGNKIKNTDRTITESGPQWTSSHSGTSMDQHTSAVQLEYSTAMKEEVCFSDLEKDVKFKDLELVFKQMKEEREIALGRSVTIQEEFNLRDKYYKQRSITSFEHSMDSDLEGISQFLDYCPIIGGVKQTLEGIIGTTLSGELINDLETKDMVVMGIFSTGIDLIPLGSILKSCNTVKSLAVAATKDIVTSEAIGYTNSFMASCGAPTSSLIIMNLLATSVFTHYNKVSPIKDLDGIQPKVNSTDIEYIDDALSGKIKSMIGDNNDVDSTEKLRTNEIDIRPNNENQNNDIKVGSQINNGTTGAKDYKYSQSVIDKADDLYHDFSRRLDDFVLENPNVYRSDGRIEYLAHGSINGTDGVFHITTRGDKIIHRTFIPASDWSRFSIVNGLPSLNKIPQLK